MSERKATHNRISDMTESIVRVDFEILSNDNVIDNSAIGDINGLTIGDTLTNGEPIYGGVLDERLGVIDRNRQCKTCGETAIGCNGHFGHIKMVEPLFYMQFIQYVKTILGCICIRCHKLLVHKNEKEVSKLKKKSGKQRFAEIKTATRNVSHCQRVGCGAPAHKITIDKKNGSVYILAEAIRKGNADEEGETFKKRSPQILTPQLCYDILRGVSDEDYFIMGFDPNKPKPENMICRNFPVPPPQVRPSVRIESASTTNDDDLTHKLMDIIKTNENLRNAKGDGSLTKTTSACDDFVFLQIHVATFFDNQQIGIPKSCQKSKKVTKSLSERLKGKEGRIRGNLMGKRVDESGRTVIGPDPYIALNEIRIPLIIAKNLTFPEIVTTHNIEYLTELVKNGNKKYPGANFVTKTIIDVDGNERKQVYHLKYRESPISLAIGDIVDRQLINGDIVLFNRQPSLHKMSMMGHFAKVFENQPLLYTFGMNPNAAKPYNADFDGDEMNIHVPQSIQTVIEMILITNAAKRCINPKNSKIAFELENDTVMGAYLQTHDNIRIDWKDAINILMSTSVKLNGKIPKNSLISGKYLYSQIIQNGINIAKKNPDGSYAFRIHNGLISDGKFTKSENQLVIQKTWRQYGSKKTMNFMDNLQKMVLKWLLIHGFTTSIQDLIVPDKTHKSIQKIVETKRKEVLSLITEYENDPYVMTSEAFELSLEAGLGSIQSDIDSVVMNSLVIPGGINMTIRSGSSGSGSNAGQNIGCIGQLVVERHRIIKKYNNRTLPVFHQYDNSAFARGFCPNSYLKGLSPWEYFFNVMAGREGVINTAIKTAETGYIQRRLVKMLEDIKVEYDGTVRNANGKIIQYVYGDNGFNTEKQIEVKIGLYEANNETIMNNFIFSDNDFAELKKKKIISDAYTSELNQRLYRKLVSMRDQLRFIQKRNSLTIVESKDSFMVPVDLAQYITNLMNNPDRKNDGIVDPYHVLECIKDMYSGPECKILKYGPKSIMKKRDDLTIKFLLKLYLYDVLAPKKCTHVYKLSKSELDDMVVYYKKIFRLAKIEGGEMVGFIAAHGIGEPVTQSNLKSFHKAGSGAAAAVSGGLPRVRELLGVSKNIKRPITTIVIDDKYKYDKGIVSRIASYLRYTVIKDVIKKVDIVYDPKPFDKNSLMNTDKATNIFEVSHGKGGCQSDIKTMPWVIRLIMSKEEMLERNINLLEFKTSFCENWSMRHEDSKNNKKEYKKIIDKITHCGITSNFDNSPIPVVHIRFNANNYNMNTLIQFQDMIVKKYRLKGIPGINDSSNIAEESCVIYDEEGNLKRDKQWVIYTEGINLKEMTQINGINLEESFCNDIVTIYETYGIEAARAAFIREFTKAIESSNGFSNYQHIEILADAVTHMGGLIAVNRFGTNKLDTDPYSRASFEQTIEQLTAAAVFGESDHIRSLSSKIMVGALINGGTGCFDLLLDHVKVKKAFKPTEEVTKTTKIKKSSLVDDLIKKKAKK